MGFCLFNSIAIGALHARAKHGIARAAVVDFDVHHGNGTQSLFWTDRALFFGSTHQIPLYPGSGAISETGAGNIFNAPLRPDDGSREFRFAMKERVLPALEAFSPDLILVSAGFDAHRDDPLGALNLVEEDYAWITRELMDIADAQCEGRVVSALEGGYNLSALASSAAAHVGALLEA
jgi:acetoin utilization deacetylase AcuC-like enzyme